jgi:hypothetical protein
VILTSGSLDVGMGFELPSPLRGGAGIEGLPVDGATRVTFSPPGVPDLIV